MEKPELIYVYDPLCGWCYGFSPVMMKVKEKYGESIRIGVVSGGMVIGEREGPVGNIAPYIKSAYKQVEEASGVKFGDNFINGTLEEGTTVFSSMPPALALTVFKSFNVSQSLDFAHAIQKMIYYDGKDPNLLSSYLELIKPYGINEKEFSDKYNDSTFSTETFKDFKLSNQLGVTGFPTVFIRHNGKLHIVTRGFDTFEKIDKKIQHLLK
jgi:putative protein-disulfide isomerase